MTRKAKVVVTRVEIAMVEIDAAGDIAGVSETIDEIEQIEVQLVEWLD